MKHMRQPGFTIIELLVVISVIVLLIAILMPALGSARDGVRALYCENQLANIMRATLTYAGENDDHLPHPNWGGNGRDIYLYGDWNHGGWLYSNPNRQSWNNDSHWTIALIRTGALWPYLGDTDVFRCPVDIPPYPPLAGQITSFSMNGSPIGYGRAPRTYQTVNFRNPSSDVIYWETEEWESGNPTIGWWWDGANHPGEGISHIRHLKRGGTLAFLDGHVEWWDWQTYQVERLSRPGKLYNNPFATDGSTAGMP